MRLTLCCHWMAAGFHARVSTVTRTNAQHNKGKLFSTIIQISNLLFVAIFIGLV